MAFDPTTARPVERAGFDPTTARPVEADVPRETPEAEEPGLMDMFTGESRMTPEMESLQEIGAAPELNRMSVPAFKASLGLLTTGETEPLKAILSQQFGDEVSYTEDSMGNVMVNLPSGQYALNKPGLSGQDIIRGAFDLAAFTPAGRAASIPGAVARNVATESAIEGAEAGVGGEFSPEDVALAGGLGGALKGVETGAGALYRGVRGTPASDVVDEATKAGIPVMTSDVARPETFATRMVQETGEKIPFVGTGGKRAIQQEARVRATEDLVEKYGQPSYSAIIDSLKTQKDRVKGAAGSVLQNVGEKMDNLGPIPLTNTQQAIQRAKDILQKPGVIKSEGALADLQRLMDAMGEAPQTFTTLKENRTAFRDILKGADKAERTQLMSRAKSSLEAVQSAMKKDMEAQARKNLTKSEFGKWQKANQIYFDEATKLTKTRLKNVLDKGDVTPEVVNNMLFSRNPSEVRALYRSLTPEGQSHARNAIMGRVMDNLNKRAAGFTPNSFATEMKKQGVQVEEFFKGEEKRKLNGLLKALNATRRAQEAAVTTPTGQTILGGGTGLAMFIDPTSTVGTALSLGATTRLYESPAVRNALLRLDSIPPGSTRFEQALREFQTIVNATAQSQREEASDI